MLDKTIKSSQGVIRFNSFDLKIIALATMLIDHIGIMFFPDLFYLRIIGRIAFVLYAFMLVEGFYLTQHFGTYIKRVGIWALLSEIPFDLAIHGQVFYIEDQNIFFTLFIGLAGMHFFRQQRGYVFDFCVLVSTLLAAYLLKVDYSWYGVALIYTFYFFRKKFPLNFIVAELLSIVAAKVLLAFQFFAFVGFIPIALYNGERGKKIGVIYYSFYAIHLLAFALFKSLMNYVN